jgi:hypothetical protein
MLFLKEIEAVSHLWPASQPPHNKVAKMANPKLRRLNKKKFISTSRTGWLGGLQQVNHWVQLRSGLDRQE